jgi:hypothetical protein
MLKSERGRGEIKGENFSRDHPKMERERKFGVRFQHRNHLFSWRRKEGK